MQERKRKNGRFVLLSVSSRTFLLLGELDASPRALTIRAPAPRLGVEFLWRDIGENNHGELTSSLMAFCILVFPQFHDTIYF